MSDIIESFQWMQGLDSFKTQDAGKHSIRIKGVCARSNEVSKNLRHYVDPELNKAARTMIGRPVLINHDPNRKSGHVDWCEHENGETEYLATVNQPQIVALIREHSTKVRGVSIGANFCFLECSKCHKRFEDQQAWFDHMTNEEFLKVDVTTPHGMVYTELSLVLEPFEAGLNTTVQIAETVKTRGLNELYETICTQKTVLHPVTVGDGFPIIEDGKIVMANEKGIIVKEKPIEEVKLVEPDKAKPQVSEDYMQIITNLEQGKYDGLSGIEVKEIVLKLVCHADKVVEEAQDTIGKHKLLETQLSTATKQLAEATVKLNVLEEQKKLEAKESLDFKALSKQYDDTLKRCTLAENALSHVQAVFKGKQKPSDIRTEEPENPLTKRGLEQDAR